MEMWGCRVLPMGYSSNIVSLASPVWLPEGNYIGYGNHLLIKIGAAEVVKVPNHFPSDSPAFSCLKVLAARLVVLCRQNHPLRGGRFGRTTPDKEHGFTAYGKE